MTDSSVYVVDANVLIEAKNRYYSFAICPGFWDAVMWHGETGAVRSVDVVRKELLAGNDQLADWVKSTAPSDAFKSTNDPDVVDWYRRIMSWAQDEPQFAAEAKDEFAQAADPWLIAYAGAKGLTLVTHESLAPNARKKVKIPNACLQFGVTWVNTFEILEELGVRFCRRPAD
jgi:hypothetical protein